LGAAMLPAEPSSGAILLRRLVDATKARVLITTPAHVTNAKDTTSGPAACRILVVQDELLSDPRSSVEGWGNDRDPHPPAPNSHLDTAALLQTSGSTGVPKLVELTHANYIFAGESTARNYGLTGDDRAFICLPLFHSGAQFFSTMASVVTFGSIGYVPQFSASGYMESIVATQSTWGVLFGPPMRMIIRRWRERGGARVDTGRFRLQLYAQSVSDAEWSDWHQAFGDIDARQGYGQTETTALRIGHSPWSRWERQALGTPFLETEVRLIDADGHDVDIGEPGELLVKGVPGVTLMKGYYKQPEVTARTMIDGWVHTGDVMIRRADGAFTFVARASHIIKRAGENLSLPELEGMLVDCPLTSEVALTAEPDELLEQKLVAFVVPNAGYSHERFLEWCVKNLGRNGRPDEVVELAYLPRSGVGKVLVGQLRQHIGQRS
ncbi:MAG: AMP-binding protein, partial [Hyphomicrobium sp.]|nr:AMP-binding protein [Hyphomicrobium sp.]